MSSKPGTTPNRRRPAFPRRWWLMIGAAVAVVTVAWAAQRGDDHEGHVLSGGDPGVTHVHGLGVDPADGTLYAATHNGLFRLPETGRATRVADRFQDTMGFTVVGPRRFLGSGHPDFEEKELLREGYDPHLGLIESTDAGETWKPLSLLGEADFHALVAAHDLIYGFSATDGEFMVSPDGKTWDRRSEIRLGSFAVSPDDPDHVVATSEAGLVTSSDGGRNWRPLSPVSLTDLSWNRDSGLWGVGQDGAVNRSPDKGVTWQRQGALPGPPEAFLVHGPVLYAAVTDQGIFRSTDGGATWQLRYRDP